MVSNSVEYKKNDGCLPSSGRLSVLFLASEWGSSKGGLSTINRELAINIAKHPKVDVTFYVPRCNDEDKKAALLEKINLVKAKRVPGMDELHWLSSPPENLYIDVVVGHGVKLGPYACSIRDLLKCKWVQVVHTVPEELGMHKMYANAISVAEKKHKTEVELCELADFVVSVGSKLNEAFRCYLSSCQKDDMFFNFTPGIFSEFSNVKQAYDKTRKFRVLLFGRGDAEDFEVKGFDIAAKAVAALSDVYLVFVGVPEGEHENVKKRFLDCGIHENKLTIRSYVKDRESLKRQFCEVDLAIMPSRTEGFGLTGLEALSAGLPVLVSGNSGFGEALGKVPFGSFFVVHSKDPQMWAAVIKGVQEKDRKNRVIESEALRSSYANVYSWEEQSEELVVKMIGLVQERQTLTLQNVSQQTGISRERHPDVLQLDKVSIVSEPSLKSAHEGESVERPKDDNSKDPGEVPMAKASGVRADIRATTMMFEAEHEECIRVLPYEKHGQSVVQFYVYNGESGIPKDLEEEAQQFFEDMNVKLEWSDLYNDSVNVLKVQRLEYSLGKPKTLTASQVDEMNDVIEKNLPELSKHRNITSVQASFKITNSTQIDKPCITIYVLGKGLIPFGESVFSNSLEGYPVDVVNGFWRRAGRFIDTSEGLIEGQEQNDVLKLGASIGVQGKEASGTLGAIVKSGGTYYALSCDHVMKSEETSIVHPGLYDHLKYLRYFLGEYKGCVDDVTGSETQCSVETLSSSQQLINKFEELRSIKEKNAISSRCTRANLKKIEKTERAFEEGREPPREIGEYVFGFSGNEKWTDDQKYFVDAAIAKLSDEEVEKLKESRSVRMFGTYIKPGSECCSAKNQAILEAEKLCKSGRTTGYTEIGDKIVGSLQPPHFMVPPSYELKAPFVTVCASRYSCENCGGSGTAVAESEAPLRCDKCNQIGQTMCEKLWFRRCLCIQQEMAKRFAGDGDSGSVIFQKIEKITPLGEKTVTLKGLGLLFGMLEHQYHRYIMASPLQVVLEALSKDLPDRSGLKVVSEF